MQTLPTNLLPHWPWDLVNKRFNAKHYGDFPRWHAALEALPRTTGTAHIDTSDHVQCQVPVSHPISSAPITQTLREFHPWRKGPFTLNEVFINTEWRSDWKWHRLAPHVQFRGKVLDIGSGNGYFGWHMLNAGAEFVVGADPSILFCMQHQVISHFMGQQPNFVVPLGIQELPLQADFDVVLSMGVIYHRREPAEHCEQLYALTTPGGQAVLESLVVPGSVDLIPETRYARMRNVWCVPAVSTLCQWMEQAGFVNVQIADQTQTSIEEQRRTQWMTFESLAESLDPQDPDKTVEGYPAPARAIVIGHRPS